jgi:cbb3-type cytochrome oxidase maturation protein
MATLSQVFLIFIIFHFDTHQNLINLIPLLLPQSISMSVLFILILLSLAIAALFVGFYYWAVKTDQFEDDYTPSVRMLFDDELTKKQSK